jgi:hypothetical protein
VALHGSRSAPVHRFNCASIVATDLTAQSGSRNSAAASNCLHTLANLNKSLTETACNSAKTRRNCATARSPPEIQP